MIEGDITLLLAGVLAHSYFFGEYSFARVLFWGTLVAFSAITSPMPLAAVSARVLAIYVSIAETALGWSD